MSECIENERIEWAHFYEIGRKLDLAAATLRIPNYIPLAALPDQAWLSPTAVAASDAYVYFTFAASVVADPDGPLITGQYLAQGITPYALPDALPQLAVGESLYFVSDKDNCWCKTIFKVLPGPRLERLDAAVMACCQTLNVPQIGARMGYGQNFIPAAYAVQWQRYKVPASPTAPATLTIDIPKCKGGPKDVRIYLTRSVLQSNPTRALYYDMTAARRKLPGTFVWPIKAAWLDSLWERLLMVIDCPNTLGSSGTVWRDSLDHLVRVGCPVTLANVISTGQSQFHWPSKPGCLTEEGCLPWNSLCCSAEMCETEGIKVYCETLHQLENIVDQLTEGFITSPGEEENFIACPECCAVCELLVVADGDEIPGSFTFNNDGIETFPFTYSFVAQSGLSTQCRSVMSSHLQNAVLKVNALLIVPDDSCQWQISLNGVSKECFNDNQAGPGVTDGRGLVIAYSANLDTFPLSLSVHPCSAQGGSATLVIGCEVIISIDAP